MTTQRLCGPQGQPCQGNCGIDCHWNTAEVETPADIAARHFWEPNQALHIEAYTGPSRLHRVLDWVGNLPHRFGRWVDRTNAGRLFCVSVGAVLAGGMAFSALVGFAK